MGGDTVLNSRLLKVEGLTKYFPAGGGVRLFGKLAQVIAVDRVSFEVEKGTTLALVGESGSGKTTVARLLTRIYEPTSGSAFIDGQDIFKARGRALKKIRREMQLIFQDPYSSLNPRRTAGQAIEEPLAVHGGYSSQERWSRVAEMLDAVGLQPEHMYRFPHEFSGGQRQRIGIARALILHPKLVIADEPVSALDVSVRAQILNLLKGLQQKFDLTYLFIAHDLALVRYIADTVAVMYMGQIVEVASAADFYSNPLHPYAKALISAVPNINPDVKKDRMKISGEMPNPASPPSGCRFRTRCPFAFERCATEEPELMSKDGTHFVRCHLYDC
jgi:oligopeptide/dipeptide ABC transporter ATP-binding protein